MSRTITFKGFTVDPEQIVDDAMSVLVTGDHGVGICLACGDIGRHGGYVDPDTTCDTCDDCETDAVMGCEEVVITFEPLTIYVVD